MKNRSRINDVIARRWQSRAGLPLLNKDDSSAAADVNAKERTPRCEKDMTRVEAMSLVLREAGRPMSVPEMASIIFEKGYWATDAKHAIGSLRMALHRDIFLRGKKSQFRQVRRGVFELRRGKEGV